MVLSELSCIQILTRGILATGLSCVQILTTEILATGLACVQLLTTGILATGLSCVQLLTTRILANLSKLVDSNARISTPFFPFFGKKQCFLYSMLC
jgi:hypothetical protein